MRMFEILDKMNLEDIEKGTRTVAVANQLVELRKTKQGALITVGADYQAMDDLASGKARLVLCVVDWETYEKIEQEK